MAVVAAPSPLRQAAIEFVHVLKVAAGDEGAEVLLNREMEETVAATDRGLVLRGGHLAGSVTMALRLSDSRPCATGEV
jgi:hypothetical protein